MSTHKAHTASSATDPDAVLAALRRARQRAERLALVTGTCLIFAENGKPVRVQPTAIASTGACEPEPDWK
jgi:hypothetical protein